MKQILRSLCTLLMLVVWASGFADEKTYSYTFVSKVFSSENVTKTLNDINWTLSAECMVATKTTYFGVDRTKGQQFGSGNQPVKTATFTTSGITGTIKSISVVAWNASKKSNMQLKVSVNGISYGAETSLASSSSGAASTDAKYTFNGNSKGEIKLVFTNNGTEGGFWFNKISVTYEDGPAKTTLSLDENAEDTGDVLLGTESGKVYDVTLTRTLTAGKWNTICLPFDVTAEQVESVLKATSNVKEFDKEDKATATIFFKPATELKAGVPYLIKPTESATTLEFKGVKITATEAGASLGTEYGVCGTFVPYKLSTDGTDLFLKTDGKFYVPAVGKETMKGFRAYFIAPKNTAGAALNLSFGEATGIDGVAADAVKNVKVYNVNGQYVGTSLDALPKGLYIVGGKKVLK